MSKLKKFLKSYCFPFAILFFVMLVLDSFKIFFLDDLAYENYWGAIDYMDFIKGRFYAWTSRLIIDTILVLLASNAGWLWKILDSIMYVILAVGIYKVFIVKRKKDKTMISIIVCLILLIPQRLLSEAGWMATSTNYLWPVSFGILSLIPIRKCLENEKLKWYQTIFYVITAIFAENNEQVATVLFVVYFIFIIYFIVKHQMRLEIAIMFLISCSSILFILLCPGNSARSMSEMEKWFVDYEMYNIIDKAFVGFYITLQYFINHFNAIYVIFSSIVMIEIFKNYKKIFYRIISTVPLFMGMAFNIGEKLLEEKIGIFEGFSFLISKFRAENKVFITLDNFDRISTYIPISLCIITLACLIISIYLIFKEKNHGLLQLLILSAGICSKFIMGFIVTVVVSQNRTSFIFIICMIILTVMIFDNKNTKELEKYLNVFAIMSFFMSISNLCLCLNIY